MSPRSFCRIVIDREPNSGSWNMAVDEALLEAAVCRRQCTLRLYQWCEATVSLGYFQESAAVGESAELAALPVVRRLTGGGAILHHHELTYCCALPATHRLARSPHQLYEQVHRRIIAVLDRYGVAAKMRGETVRLPDEPFLCFGRPHPTDILCRGRKILGSAQRRRRGALLQHGSLLLQRSQHAPQFPGIAELVPTARLNSRLHEAVAAEVGSLLDPQMVQAALNEQDRWRAFQLEQDRYRAVDWKKPGSGPSERAGNSGSPPGEVNRHQ